ncbi:MAG TPA: YkgJ family cysteine cluster protein [Candidatus Binataceae bacterium]|nr:YkgJ family cysteine cluster protein [Candidatus Binataceae bacterium]
MILYGQSNFSYTCNACGLCCHDKVIALSPYDLMRIARAAEISTRDAIERFTIRRGSILRFDESGACTALDGKRCSVHDGRPLACRLYPLGLERRQRHEQFVTLEPARGSPGVFGENGTVEQFLDAQEIAPYCAANQRYHALLPLLRERINALVDFETVEPREFWRRATREALAESGYGPNPIIDALFDADRDRAGCTVEQHLDALRAMAARETDAQVLASAAILLAVSLGYTADEAIG